MLFIGGSLNQTTMMHKISEFLNKNHDCFFSYYYGSGAIDYFAEKGVLDFTILGGKFKNDTMKYLNDNNLEIDEKGQKYDYDLVIFGADLIIPKNIQDKPIVLVQEGMTDPENLMYYLVKWLKLPRWLASTSTMGLSHKYQKFCVASNGYKDHFIKKGVDPEKIEVTGIPNFDNMERFKKNKFPHKNFVMVATSDTRETFKYDNRKKFIKKVVKIADGRKIIFKLHPNEKVNRAVKEINKYAPGSLVYRDGKTEEMIANCDVLVTQYSSVVYVGLALEKECYSYFNIDELKRLQPIQNRGESAKNIARVCRSIIE